MEAYCKDEKLKEALSKGGRMATGSFKLKWCASEAGTFIVCSFFLCESEEVLFGSPSW